MSEQLPKSFREKVERMRNRTRVSGYDRIIYYAVMGGFLGAVAGGSLIFASFVDGSFMSGYIDKMPQLLDLSGDRVNKEWGTLQEIKGYIRPYLNALSIFDLEKASFSYPIEREILRHPFRTILSFATAGVAMGTAVDAVKRFIRQ
ncbi:hypothetical protein A2617_02790 [Candidatus Daviesbacteria bacterium RIFOXYD1_FULL_41_10]|uniref:Uncharacterized protein n=1 Tax=Candidatus Daviesbacteria bacterium RIFOXYD1_FULL_41_10 TaxID=1797801 RepID=A0A1F5N376_9BACT|nr:MAG: hypothetical protein A2617_02790 [Candidatus Daviesbacteria bacterium RIFOXYD1_FULL_41_10]